ncbi:Condensin-2 complex subunit H2 [Acropora cervicornis]|uniref:Condensin-2 complex subunit H2 n=1 Tax=Acropora cervicornis TaxID=6130 RepID=A0AAD9VCL9_ACRCE|nr:Condensin-2 complex subunit H2 [Acropora cervicornis]
MPSQASSSDSNDLASKYGHLLQPIRDLTKNWDIDVAAQLEEYLAEIERIKISFDGGKTSMNFAEAALVEYLYTLVYQTLDLIASKKRLQQASSVDDQGKDNDASFKDNSEEFLLLDDIKEAKNIDLKEDEGNFLKEGSQIIPRTPLVLLPLGEKDKEDPLLSRTGEVLGSRNDFKMNTCRVHSSGTLLLDLTHLPLLDRSYKQMTFAAVFNPKDQQLASDVQTTGPDLAKHDGFDAPESMYNLPGDGEESLGQVAVENDQEEQEERIALRARFVTPQQTTNKLPVQRDLQVFSIILWDDENLETSLVRDLWKLLDPYDPGLSKDRPYKKGKPFKKPSSLVSQQHKKKRKREEIKKVPALIPINQFISQAFYSHASKMVKNPLKTPAFPEFEYLYWIEFRRQQQVQAKQKKLVSHLAAGEEIEELKTTLKPDEEDDVANEELGLEDDQAVADYDDDDDDFVGGEIENDGYLFEAQQFVKETDLSRRVRDWEERILPVLSKEETHRPFDIHKYGEEIMASFKGKCNQAFKELVHGKEAFEICRLFLATLQLANNYNVEITADGVGEKSVDTMKLRLMKVTPGNQAIATFQGSTSP